MSPLGKMVQKDNLKDSVTPSGLVELSIRRWDLKEGVKGIYFPGPLCKHHIT